MKTNIEASTHGTSPTGLRNRIHRVFRLLWGFLLGQGALQSASVLVNLYLVRTLSVDSYAQYGLAFGFQTTVAALMDFGLASTIIPLVGERFEDRCLVGKYVQTAKRLRDRSFWIMSPLVTAAFLFITVRHHWSAKVQALLLFSVLVSLFFSGQVSYFSAPLFLYRRFRSYYVPQTLTLLGRLISYVSIGGAGLLNGAGAALLNAANTIANGWFIKRESSKLFELTSNRDRDVEKEMIRYIVPAIPAIVLGAFQGQVSLFLIGIFGYTTSVAEVAALGRLGQLLTVLMSFNIVVVEPYVARLPRERLRSAYLKLLAGGIAGAAVLSVFAFLEPNFFLWILGPNYRDLRSLIGWVILTVCINYVAGLLWIMNRSRRWIFWRGTVLEISLIFVIQIGYLVLIGVRTTSEAVFFNFASSFCYIITHGYIALYGHSNSGSPRETYAK